MENARCCHGKERFLKFDLNTLRRVLNEQNWLPIKKKLLKRRITNKKKIMKKIHFERSSVTICNCERIDNLNLIEI
jgi:hypothetical protein